MITPAFDVIGEDAEYTKKYLKKMIFPLHFSAVNHLIAFKKSYKFSPSFAITF